MTKTGLKKEVFISKGADINAKEIIYLNILILKKKTIIYLNIIIYFQFVPQEEESIDEPDN